MKLIKIIGALLALIIAMAANAVNPRWLSQALKKKNPQNYY